MTLYPFIASVISAALAGQVLAQTSVTVVCDKDATLYVSAAGDLANGQGSAMFAGMTGQPAARRALVQFDLAGVIPAGSRILSATLQLSVQASGSASNMETDLHRVTQSWTEGPTVAPGSQGGGGPASLGDVTWLHSNYPNSLWANAGGDFDATPSCSFGLQSSGITITESVAGTVRDVQGWVDNPNSNYGWLLKGDESLTQSATKMFTHESANLSDHPRIHISYLLPGDTGVYGTGCPVASGTLDLDPLGSANGGSLVSLDYSNGPTSSIGATFFSLELDTAGTALFPMCSVYLPLSGVLIAGDTFVTDPSGSSSPSFTVPAGFPGYLIVCQGAVLDTTPVGFSMSNAGLMLTQ